MRSRCAAVVATLSVALGSPAVTRADEPTQAATRLHAAGEAIYRRGQLPTGEPLRATVQGDVFLSGEQAACTSCHRRSGFGSSEGRSLVRPVTGDALYRPVTVGLVGSDHLWRSQGAGTRPAYTDTTLARALRTGVDPAGRTLDPLMPRYDLDDESVGALVAYLKSLSTGTAPGVDESTLHFATIVADGVDARRRQGLLDVLTVFFRDKNANTRNETGRKARGPMDMRREYGSYRTWKLHVWELHGAPETWAAQLGEHYRKQPVFAVLGGVAPGSWRPIHEFCEAQQLPCIFPSTDEPVDAEHDFYTVYFSRGLPLEASALAAHLERATGAPVRRVLQAYRDEAEPGAPAALRRALAAGSRLELAEHVFSRPGPPAAAEWTALLERERPDVLVTWLPAADLQGLGGAGPALAGVGQVALSASLLGDRVDAIPPTLRAKAVLVSPLERPDQLDRRLTRSRGWMRNRGVQLVDDRVQSGTFFALTVAGEAMMELRGNFSREYFVERIEHMIDGMINTSPYPRLTLAPGARFASQGCYLVRPDESDPSRLVAVSDWIVP